MPPDDVSPYTGFHSYADGTPRAYPDDGPGARPVVRWSPAPAYLDDADAGAPQADWRRIAVVAGAAAGLTAAATFGWTVLQRRGEAPPAAVAAMAPAGVQVVVTDPPPAPPVPRRARLEVLPSSPPSARAEPVTPAAVLATAPSSPQSRPALRPAPAPRNEFNRCADAPTAARRMVCSDMRVAAADQRMKAAYAAALAAGIPHRRLARDQDEWLEVREDAAKVSRRAVLNAYRRRTHELSAMAKGG